MSFRGLFYLTALLPLASGASFAATYDVYTDDDLQSAAASAGVGDTVRVHAGRYLQGFSPTNSGSATQPLVFVADPGVVIDGRLSSTGILLRGKRYITIQGFTLRNIVGEGILVEGDPSDTPAISGARQISILDNTIINTGDSGIKISGQSWFDDPAACLYHCVSNVLISGNTVEQTNNKYIRGGGYNEAITVTSGIYNVTVKNNIVRNNVKNVPGTAGYDRSRAKYMPGVGGEGIDIKEGARSVIVSDNQVYNMDKNAIYIDGGGSTCFYPETYSQYAGTLTGIHVMRNLVDNTANSGITITSEGLGRVNGVFVYNNVVSNSKNDGILVYDWDLDTKRCADNQPTRNRLPSFKDIRIFNNTLFNNGRGGVALDHGWSAGVQVYNNILVGTNPVRKREVSGLNADVGAVNFAGSVDFVNASNLDFRLRSTTRNLANLVDAPGGSIPFSVSSFEFKTDFADANRLKGSDYDMGAFELR